MLIHGNGLPRGEKKPPTPCGAGGLGGRNVRFGYFTRVEVRAEVVARNQAVSRSLDMQNTLCGDSFRGAPLVDGLRGDADSTRKRGL